MHNAGVILHCASGEQEAAKKSGSEPTEAEGITTLELEWYALSLLSACHGVVDRLNPHLDNSRDRSRFLGLARFTSLAAKRIVHSGAHSLHRCRRARIKIVDLSENFPCSAKRKDRPFGRSLRIPERILPQVSCPRNFGDRTLDGPAACFEQIPDFGQQSFLHGEPRLWRWFLEPVYLFNHDEEAKSNDYKFNYRVNE
jgi:hypothetical protein